MKNSPASPLFFGAASVGFFVFANALDVRIGAEGITSTRTLLVITIRTRFVPSFSFTEFRKKKRLIAQALVANIRSAIQSSRRVKMTNN